MTFPWATVAKLTVFALFSAFVLSIMWNTLSNTTSGPLVSYRADFTDASGLRSGDSVRIAGVKVGKVGAIHLHGDLARVEFSVQKAHSLHRGTKLLIRYENLIGQRYLSVRPNDDSGEPLPRGATIGRSHTEPALDLSTLMNGFEPLFDVLSPRDINKVAGTIIKVLQGEGATVKDLLRDVGSISTDVAQFDDVLGRTVTTMADVVTRLARQSDEFVGLVTQTRTLVTQLSDNRSEIGSAIASMDGVTTALSTFLAQTRPALKSDLRKAQRVLTTFARDRDVVGQVLKITPDFWNRAAGFAQYGSWIALYPCHINVNLLGIDAPLLNDVALGHHHSAVCQ